MLEMILLEIENNLGLANIDKRMVRNYGDIYALSLDDLERLSKMNLGNPFYLTALIDAFNIEEFDLKEEKLALLDYVSKNLDFSSDRVKINSCLKVVNNLEKFQGDYCCAERIVEKIAASKTDEGAKISSLALVYLLDSINEEEYSDRIMDSAHVRISEVVGFISRMEEDYKVDASQKIIERYYNGNLGSLCSLLAVIGKTNNSKQAHAIVDGAINNKVRNNHLEVQTALCASKADDYNLEELYNILGFANMMTGEELDFELEELFKNESKKNSKIRTRIK